MVTAEGPGLDGRQPVGAFVSAPFTLNDGAGIVPALVINTIAVRPSHRRRGLLTEMMRRHLDAARAEGRALAVLTASEGTIYGRYGFGVCNRRLEVQVDTRRLRFREEVEPAEGTVEFVAPAFLEPHLERIWLSHQARYRGAAGIQHAHRLVGTGAWDRDEEGPSRGLRAVVHFDTDGEPDGFALFKFKGWDTEPITTSVQLLCSPEAAIDRALWHALATTDLVENLDYGLSHPGDPLPLALVDPWAVKVKGAHDWVWLRILDLPKAVSQRGFESDGEVTIGLTDAMGYCSGSWRLSVHEGRGQAVETQADPEVRLDVESLARMWFGDRTAAELALGGLVHGERDPIARLSRLFATAEPPVNLSTF
nr:GNAT family N-acetyltransferase [Tessaracoccus sp. OS52]